MGLLLLSYEVRSLFQNFFSKIKEALLAVLPVTAIVLLIHFTILPLPAYILQRMVIGILSLVIGMSFFTLGADVAIMPMGENIGEKLSKTRNLVLMLALSAVIGIMITIAEPDLHVLAEQFKTLPKMTLIIAVAGGVGAYFVIALVRIIFKIKMSYILAVSYGIIIIMSFFVPNDFLGVAFDAGGVTTGAITVPFILAIGIGISSVRGGKSNQDDSFGLLGLCSVGPIMAIMLLGIITDGSAMGTYEPIVVDVTSGFGRLMGVYNGSLPNYITDVALSLAPVIVFYTLFAIIALKTTKSQNLKIVIGVIYTFIGVVIFLTGVNLGFVSLGNYLGLELAKLEYNWILIVIGVVIGLSIVAAEPSVQVLVKQVENLTGGSIKKGTMLVFLSIGVAISIGFCMLRLLNDIPIMYFLIPGYIVVVVLSFFVPNIFTSIAIDSGGIASGTITVAFVLPLAMGASQTLGGNIMQDAFGVSGMVAMTPIITIQILGLIYKIKIANQEKKLEKLTRTETEDHEIIEFE